MILDRSRFDEIAARLMRDGGAAQELKKSDMAQKRREAILSGAIV